MLNPSLPRKELSKPRKALVYVVLLFVVVGVGGRPLARGQLFYQNYWGGAVFVPTILLVGAIILIAALRNLSGRK